MTRLIERWPIPDGVVRLGVRHRLRRFLDAERSEPAGAAAAGRFAETLRTMPVTVETEAANRQHYEVPASFFEAVLGHQKKYSCCLWEPPVETLDEAEEAMLELTARRAGVRDGQRILDLGCGWGSFTLWAARRFPSCRILAVSNSRSQCASIERDARRAGLGNVRVVTADVADFSPGETFDRIVSVEMLEHVRNVEELLRRAHGWLAQGGALFAHVFCHRARPYFFEDEAGDFFGSRFFTGGMMPSWDLLPALSGPLELEERWMVGGTHYARTLRAWLERLDAHRAAALAALEESEPDRAAARRALRAWRLFFLATEEAFGIAGGREWLVGHYLFRPRPAG